MNSSSVMPDIQPSTDYDDEMERMSKSCEIHPLYQDFECLNDFHSFKSWCMDHPNLPLISVIAYMIAIYLGSMWMRNRIAYDLKGPLFVWNFGLAIFSILGMIRCGTELLHILSINGFRSSICDNQTDNVTALWRYSFVMSKFAELFDTFFIIARKKPLMFLHWYHHVTVLLFTWDTHMRQGSSSRYFVFLNFTVHSIMYSYYAMQSGGFAKSLMSNLSILITSLQIMQMVAGILVLIQVNSHLDISGPNSCSDSKFTVISGILMYASYFLLFGQFFLRRYLFTPRGSSKSKQKQHNGGQNNNNNSIINKKKEN